MHGATYQLNVFFVHKNQTSRGRILIINIIGFTSKCDLYAIDDNFRISLLLNNYLFIFNEYARILFENDLLTKDGHLGNITIISPYNSVSSFSVPPVNNNTQCLLFAFIYHWWTA